MGEALHPRANVRSRTLLSTIQVGYPFIRRQAQTLRGSMGTDYVNQDVRLDGIDLTQDHLRVGFAQLGIDAMSSDFSNPAYSLTEPRWHATAIVALRQGLDIFGASSFCGNDGSGCGVSHVPTSTGNGRPTATVLRSAAYGEFRPIPHLTFALGVLAQYAWKPLLSFEQFSAGNYTVGRGYDPGALLGDRGWGTQAEIRAGSRTQVSTRKPALEGYACWDHAKVDNVDPVIDVSGRQASEFRRRGCAHQFRPSVARQRASCPPHPDRHRQTSVRRSAFSSRSPAGCGHGAINDPHRHSRPPSAHGVNRL